MDLQALPNAPQAAANWAVDHRLSNGRFFFIRAGSKLPPNKAIIAPFMVATSTLGS
jgi:hypothetical protein